MYFLDELRGAGLGTHLLEILVDAARDAGYSSCYLETMDNMSQARKLYLKHGFRPIENPLGSTGHGSCNRFMMKDL
jgi:putative acetyltransferase